MILSKRELKDVIMTTPISTRIIIKKSVLSSVSLAKVAFAIRRITSLDLEEAAIAKGLKLGNTWTLTRDVIYPKYWDLSSSELADFCELHMEFGEDEYKSMYEQAIHDPAIRLMKAGAAGDTASAIEFCKLCADGRYSPSAAFA